MLVCGFEFIFKMCFSIAMIIVLVCTDTVKLFILW